MVALCAPSGRAAAVVVEEAVSGLKCMVELEKGLIRRWMKEDMVYALSRPRKRSVNWVVGFRLGGCLN